FGAGDSRGFQRLVENAAGGTDERLAGKVFLVPRLLADQHEVRTLAPLSRHRLGGMLVERAAPAFVLGLGKLAQRRDRQANIIIGLELKFFLHPVAGINAGLLHWFGAPTPGSLPADIKTSLYLDCGAGAALL